MYGAKTEFDPPSLPFLLLSAPSDPVFGPSSLRPDEVPDAEPIRRDPLDPDRRRRRLDLFWW